jgi:hypothetical protein
MVFFACCASQFSGPPARGFTVPMDATLASAASRACSSGIRSGKGSAAQPWRLSDGARARGREPPAEWLSIHRCPRGLLQLAVILECSPPRGVNSPVTVALTGLAAATTSRKNRFTTFS